MADVTINFSAQTQRARQNLSQLETEVQNLRQRLGETSASARQATAGVDAVGTQSRETAGQVKIVSASFAGLESRMNDSRRAALTLRDRLNLLNAELAENRKSLLTADNAQKAIIDTRNRAIRVNQGLLRSEAARNSAVLAGLTQERRELRGATQATGRFSQATSLLGANLAAVGIDIATRGVVNFARGSVSAAAQMEALERGLRLVEGSSLDAGMRLEMLREIANLPGLQLAPLVRYNNTLREVGLTTNEVDTVVTSLGNAIVSFGGDAETVDRVFTQLSQSFSQNKLEAEDFNTVLENVPSLRGIIQDVLGLSGSTEDLGDAFKETGGDLIDFLLPVFERLQEEIPTAPLDSYAASTDTLRNSFFRLQSELGERLLPAIGSVSRGLAGLFDNISDGITRTKNFTETFAELNTEITRASGRIELQEAISGGVEALEVFIRQSEAAIRNNSVFFGGREDAILIGQINQAKDAYTELVGVQEMNIETEADLRAELVLQENELLRIQGLQTDRNDLIAEQGRSAERASRIYLENLTEEEIAVNASIDDLEKKLTAFEAIPPAIEAAEPPTEAVTEKTKALTTEVLRLTEVYNDLTRNIQQASEQAALIVGAGGVDFFRLVRGEITAYNASIDTVIPSLINFQNEQDALNESIQRGIDATNEAVGDPLTDYINSIGLTSEAADNARSTVEKASDAVVDLSGNAADAERGLRDLDGSFQLSEATIPRVTSAMREFTGTAPDIERVERAVESTTRSIDDLLDSVERVPGEVETSFGVIEDAFNTIPGLLIGIAQEDADISDAFGDLGETIGESLITNLSSTLADNLGGAVSDALAETEIGEALGIGDIVGAISAAGGLGGIGTALAAVAIPLTALTALIHGVATRDDSAAQARNALGGDLLTQDEVRGFQGSRGGEIRGPDATAIVVDDDGVPVRTATRPGGVGTPASLSGGANKQRRDQENESVAPAGLRYNATLGGYEPIPVIFDQDASGGSGLGAPRAVEAEIPEPELPGLDSIFQLSGDQRGILAPFEQAVDIAQGVVDDLTESSTPEEIQAAYTNLANAEQAVNDTIVGFITNATNITEDARGRALTLQGQLFGNEIERANNDLLDAYESIGVELVTGITNMSGILSGSALAVRAIPEEVEDAITTEDAPAQETQILSNVHRFTGTESNILGGLESTVEIAQTAVDRLDADSTPEEIATAYGNLTAAEQALFNQQITFIQNATGITETARENAEALAEGRFEGEIFDANTDLVDALEGVGLQLTTTITDWYGILTGAALAVENIPPPVVPEPDAPEPEALSDVHRFSQAENRRLDILRGNVTAAEDAVGLLDETSTEAEIQEAYAALTVAEQALFNQKLTFIGMATGITEVARTEAETLAEGRFGREIFDANQRLIRSLADIGLELITMFDATTGILMGTALTTQAIAQETVAAGDQSQGNNNLLQNAIQRARFNLTGATTEAEFETARQNLITAVNAYYDAEETRINGLGLTEDELADKRQDNDLARDRALRSATGATNRFQNDRIAGEESAAAAAQRIYEDELEAKMRAAMDFNDALADLDQDRIDAEERRADRLVDLEQDTQDRIADIQRNANRTAEDIEREYQRDVADILRQEVEGSLTRDEATSQLFGLGRERNEDLEDLGIRTGRRGVDAGIRQQRGERDIDTEAQERLLGIQQETAALEMTNAVTDMANIEMLGTAAGQHELAAESLMGAGASLEEAARSQGFEDVSSALINTSITLSLIRTDFQTLAQGVSNLILGGGVSAASQNVQASGQPTPGVEGGNIQVTVEPQEVTVQIDGKEVAKAVSNPLAKLTNTRRAIPPTGGNNSGGNNS